LCSPQGLTDALAGNDEGKQEEEDKKAEEEKKGEAHSAAAEREEGTDESSAAVDRVSQLLNNFWDLSDLERQQFLATVAHMLYPAANQPPHQPAEQE
jgi:hypothetical protein